MVPSTRRALLQGATALAAALAGCSGLGDSSRTATPTAPRDDGPDGPTAGTATDPERLRLRVDTDRAPLWLADQHGDGGGRPTASERDRWRESFVVDDQPRADRLNVAAPIDGDRVEAFLAATDFAAETIYVEIVAVGACFRLELCHVRWSPSEIATDYTRRTRPYTERCAVDELVTEARLIRIPDRIDADTVSGFAAGIGTGPCDRRRGDASPEPDGTETASNQDARTESATTASGGEQ